MTCVELEGHCSGVELDLTDYNQRVVIEMVKVVMAAHEFVNVGDPHMALDWFRGAVDVLDDEGLADVADAQLFLSEAAFYVGSISRLLGRLEEAIGWGKFALRVNDRKVIVSNSDPSVLEDVKQGRYQALQLIGNCYFDQQHFTTSCRYHLHALLTKLELDPGTADCRAALTAVDSLSSVSVATVLALINLGNSIGMLNDKDLYEDARTTAILAAAKMTDLEQYAASADGRYMLGMLLAIFDVQLKSDDPAVGRALSRVRSVFGADPPRIQDYVRPG